MTGEREFFANIQNEFLIDGGHAARVDHRSHADRGIDRNPEQHLEQAGVKSLSDWDLKKIRSSRKGEGEISDWRWPQAQESACTGQDKHPSAR